MLSGLVCKIKIRKTNILVICGNHQEEKLGVSAKYGKAGKYGKWQEKQKWSERRELTRIYEQ